MGIYDLVFILSVLLSFVTILGVIGIAVTGRFEVAWRILRGWMLWAAAYLVLVVIASLFTRPRVLAMGIDRCFDDWCIAVERIDRTDSVAVRSYAVTFRLSSRARRARQRERHLVAYVRDADGCRYDPDSAEGDPFDVMLAPGEAVRTTRVFELPAGPASASPRLVIAHEGGFPIGWFIIGEGPFAKGMQVTME